MFGCRTRVRASNIGDVCTNVVAIGRVIHASSPTLVVEGHTSKKIARSRASVARDPRRTMRAVDPGVAHRVEGRRILGKFSFEYTYEPDRKLITVCGTDFASARDMCLTTVPVGTTEVCRQRVGFGGGFRADDLGANPRWNYATAHR